MILPVADLEAALSFYVDVLGMSLIMRDGDRFATVSAGQVKLALTAPQERSVADGVAIAFKLASLHDVTQRLRAGDHDVPEPVQGAHEHTVEVVDPDGHALIFYQPR